MSNQEEVFEADGENGDFMSKPDVKNYVPRRKCPNHSVCRSVGNLWQMENGRQYHFLEQNCPCNNTKNSSLAVEMNVVVDVGGEDISSSGGSGGYKPNGVDANFSYSIQNLPVEGKFDKG